MKRRSEPLTTQPASPPQDASSFSMAPGGGQAVPGAQLPDPDRIPVPGEGAPAPAPRAEPRGLECRACGCNHFRVLYTRQLRGGKIKRRRQCMNSGCGREITTYEREVVH